jgi:hypothetical protein
MGGTIMDVESRPATRREALLLGVAGALWILGAGSSEADTEPFLTAFEMFGVSASYKSNSVITNLLIRADRAKFIKAVPEMKAIQLMNDEISQGWINLHQTLFSGVFLLRFTPALVHELYTSKPEIDKSDIRGVMTVVDDYGSENVHDVFSCKFDKALHKRINWEHFREENFAKVAPQFRFSQWYMQQADGDRRGIP